MTKETIKILYEDKNLLAINKPAGLVVHSDGRTKEPTVVDWLLKKYPTIKKVGDPSTSAEDSGQVILRPGIVHRLDKDTSGVLIIAKNQKAFDFLKNQFAERDVKKEYVALIDGHLKKEWGIIDLPIGKSKTDFRKKSTHIGKLSGKIREAKTEYKLLERFGKYDLVQIMPKTGRTHQIRVHMRALNHPVVCDKLYGFKSSICPEGVERQFLHAKSVELKLLDGKVLKVEAELPKGLKAPLERLRAK